MIIKPSEKYSPYYKKNEDTLKSLARQETIMWRKEKERKYVANIFTELQLKGHWETN